MIPQTAYIGDVDVAARAHSGTVDTPALRIGRLARLRAEMARQGMGVCVLLDPINIRYATGARNMQVFMARNPSRYLFMRVDGPLVLFEFPGSHHLAAHLETVDEVRSAVAVSAVAAGRHLDDRARRWATELTDLTRRHAGAGVSVWSGPNHGAARLLEAAGFEIVDAQQAVERARSRRPRSWSASAPPLRPPRPVLRDWRRRSGRVPASSENEVWEHLHAANIEQDGDYVEARLFNSGPRTNPWFQEASPRRLKAGEPVALDTDVVGPYGYYSDLSRTFLCGDGRPTKAQRTLYRLAYEQIHHDMEELRPGRRQGAREAHAVPLLTSPIR